MFCPCLFGNLNFDPAMACAGTYNGWTRVEYMEDYESKFPHAQQYSSTEWNRWMVMSAEADMRRRMLNLKKLIEEMETFSVESEMWAGREGGAKRPRLELEHDDVSKF